MFKMKNETYDLLKFIAQYILPASATLYITLGNIWKLPYPQEVGATIMALDTFLGVCLGISTETYKKEKELG